MKDIQTDIRKYGVLYFLIMLHLFGGGIANAAIVVSSVYAFIYFVFKREVDLYVVFLLLFTNICMGQNSDAENVSNINVGIYNNFKNVLILGPLALSTKFTFVLAIPFRALINITKSKNYFLLAGWYLLILLSLIGLLMSFTSGIENKSGLTVGFRIALTMGVILLPQMVSHKDDFLRQFDKIMYLSLVTLALGLMNAHWLFIVFGFLPFMWFRFKSLFAKVFIIICLGRVLIGVDTTITIVGTILVSLGFAGLVQMKMFNTKSLSHVGFFLIVIPIILTIIILIIPNDKIGYDFQSVTGYIKFKLIGDRKPIWDASYLQIITQNFFIAPAGSSLEVYFDYIQQWRDWPEGSHNIFLETGRQISYFGMLFLGLLIVKALTWSLRNVLDLLDCRIVLCFVAVYMVFGLSGQHIVYDGVGFMFWLLLGQLTSINKSENENIAYIGG
ncbi:hypothetical protein [Pedobacter duraquae]|uniref:O-antigen ligase n=1 Tax=Pedobacter duraquae TaxID=425511 RepID=A0A4R6IJ19_9SPHI|nr:hypothetical protein [Pedobacter duraquae]TDO21973.1 hypothetical protein CLV32_3082 [Pedobacter duraquae]